MKLGTRLLLPLLATVALVMTLYALWALRQREDTLGAEARRETAAYATALGLALEGALRDPDPRGVQEAIARIGREPSIYGVFVYDAAGRPLHVSEPLRADDAVPAAGVRRRLTDPTRAGAERVAGGQPVYSQLRPILDEEGALVGAFEVVQPLGFLAAEKARTRLRFALNTLTLLAAVTVLIQWLVRRLVADPLDRFVAAARALGRGELAHRIATVPAGGELAALAAELNRMAEGLEAAQARLVRETEERVALERRLRETEKMAAVGSLAAGVAHEIAAPLHVIRGRAEMLLRKGENASDAERNLRIITDETGRITRVVRNLLDFSRRREPRLERTDLVEVLRGVLELVEPDVRRLGIDVSARLPERAWVRGDPDLLHQLFTNLVLNAIQAVAQQDGAEKRIRVRTLSAGHAGQRAVETVIEDSGPGVGEADRDHIFEPFFTTRTDGGGTGLGLAVVRGIVDEHGGAIRVEGEPGAGARFHVVLPAAPEAEHA